MPDERVAAAAVGHARGDEAERLERNLLAQRQLHRAGVEALRLVVKQKAAAGDDAVRVDRQADARRRLEIQVRVDRTEVAVAERNRRQRADTIEQLAAMIGIDPAALRGTVDRFNGFVARGRDEDFHRGERAYDNWLGDEYHKPSMTLGTIEQGPFYAVEVVPGDVGTYGGVVTDTNARVLRDAEPYFKLMPV